MSRKVIIDIFMKNIIKIFIVAVVAAPMLISCGIIAPKSFQRAVDGGSWSSVMVREDLSYDRAFGEVMDVIGRRFELDMISKDGGYLRTNWIYTWNKKGKYTTKYRTRIVIKFSSDKRRIDIKSEAEFGGEPRWVKGFDTALLTQTKQDIMGVVGTTVL